MTIEPKTYASESNHWYFPDGRPAHEQPNKSKPGKMRPTNLTDARKIGLYPSVSGILAIQAKPGLDFWKKEQVAKAAWETENCGDSRYGEQDWIDDVLAKAEENMSRARDLGSEIHGAIERYLKLQAYMKDQMEPFGGTNQDVKPHFSAHSRCVEAAVDALKELGVWGQPFRAERSFASDLGWGGCADITDGETWICDFKCCDSLEKKLDYMDRCAQLTAYAGGLFGNWQASMQVNIFISTSEPGKYLIREWTTEEKVRGWQTFIDCFRLWKTVNQYDPLSIAGKPAP